ncbi:MAG: universal stress protein [Desulfobulbus sp.]|nr:universal stress protein [Desulfobulbus sp.]
MLEIMKIVVPVDFHKHTDALAQFAVDVAGKLGATLIFLHVVDNFTLTTGFGDSVPESYIPWENELIASAQTKIDNLVDKYQSACPGCTGKVFAGDIVDCIVEYAKKENCVGLIVMGTHGARGIEKILLGSVAQRVLQRAQCPILVFNPYRN